MRHFNTSRKVEVRKRGNLYNKAEQKADDKERDAHLSRVINEQPNNPFAPVEALGLKTFNTSILTDVDG